MNHVKLLVVNYKKCDKTLIVFFKKWLNTAAKMTKMNLNDFVKMALSLLLSQSMNDIYILLNVMIIIFLKKNASHI